MGGEDDDGGGFELELCGYLCADGVEFAVDRMARLMAGVGPAVGKEIDGCSLSGHCGEGHVVSVGAFETDWRGLVGVGTFLADQPLESKRF